MDTIFREPRYSEVVFRELDNVIVKAMHMCATRPRVPTPAWHHDSTTTQQIATGSAFLMTLFKTWRCQLNNTCANEAYTSFDNWVCDWDFMTPEYHNLF
jgi:hypothetical protein